MALTEEHKKIIAKHPLNDTFDRFQAKSLGANDADGTEREDIANILVALIGSAATDHLPAPDCHGHMATRLLSVYHHVRGGAAVSLDHFRALLRCVIDKATDVDIWAAVFAMVDDVGAAIPPFAGMAPTFSGPPIKSTWSLYGDSETHRSVQEEPFVQIQHCTFRNVGGFFDKFFNPDAWSAQRQSMVKALMAAHNGSRWTDFPAAADEEPVWGWFKQLEQRYLCDAPHKLHTIRTASQLQEQSGYMDLYFRAPPPPPNAATATTFEYKNVLVVGKQKCTSDSSRIKADLVQLTRHVQGVFSDQPTRRFVHAFSLYNTTMELWVFDRSGPYSSGPFDIHDEPAKFSRAFVGYATMDDDAMGLDTFMERVGWRRFLELHDLSGQPEQKKRFRLDIAMVRQQVIVGPGTACYLTRDGHLQRAEQRGVQGVARVVARSRITSIAEMRHGLDFSRPPLRFRDFDRPLLIASTNTSSIFTKCESSSHHASVNASESKRRRSDHASDDTPESKRQRRQSLAAKSDEQSLVSKPKPSPSPCATGENLVDNKIYSCVVISPAGRVISDFRTVRELLESMRDAIKAHQSLYTAGNILHRDISSNNIIITDPDVADGFKGILIDLDRAVENNNSGPSAGACHRTGTLQFMAIEVLCKVHHTYRHDLESFFYVLIWLCARQSWHNGFARQQQRPTESRLRRWQHGSLESIADTKMFHISVYGLEKSWMNSQTTTTLPLSSLVA
ncbi:serine/threonine-protein kinase Sgk2 [Trichoderma austrokoningii]